MAVQVHGFEDLAEGFDLAILSHDELKRWHDIKDPTRKSRFLYSRLLLKQFLESEFGSLGDFQLASKGHGKPYLVNSHFDFNISHTGDRIAIAAAQGFDVGVDIEYPRHPANNEAVMNKVFQTEEIKLISGAEDFNQEFTYYWSMKEAIVKTKAGSMLKDGKAILLNERGLNLQALPEGYGAIQQWNILRHTLSDGLLVSLSLFNNEEK